MYLHLWLVGSLLLWAVKLRGFSQLEEELECILKVSERMNGRMESEEKE